MRLRTVCTLSGVGTFFPLANRSQMSVSFSHQLTLNDCNPSILPAIHDFVCHFEHTRMGLETI
jgi:hypothetical protein